MEPAPRSPTPSLLVFVYVSCLTMLPAQTRVIDLDAGGSSTPAQFIEWRGATYLQAYDFSGGPSVLRRRLWRSDGTAAGTLPLVPAPSDWRFVAEPTPTSQLLFFTVTTDASGTELWATDGTPAGTRLVRDIGPGAENGGVRGLCALGDTLFFIANTVEQTPFGPLYGSNAELWRSDGTAAGTQPVADLTPGFTAPASQIDNLVAGQGALYFLANPTGSSRGLWRSDGSAAGTVELAFPKTSGKPAVTQMVVHGPLIHFLDEGDLWWSLGTTAATFRLAAGSFTDLLLAGDALFLRRNDTLVGWTNGQPVDLVTMKGMDWFKTAPGRLYFRGDDGQNGREPWTSDGTVTGTRMVVDLLPGPGSGMEAPDRHADPHFFEPIGTSGHFVFVGISSPASGLQIHVSDGTAAGTRQLTNFTYLFPTHGPGDFHHHGPNVFFRCHDQTGDVELWSLPVAHTQAPVAEPYGLACGHTTPLTPTPPRIGASGSPALGNPGFAITLDGGRPAAPALLLFGLARAPLAWSDCQPAVQPVFLGPVSTTDAFGQLTLPLAVPGNAALLGTSATFQWGVLEPQGRFLGIASLSEGLLVVVGR